jgi:hypothetical protein
MKKFLWLSLCVLQATTMPIRQSQLNPEQQLAVVYDQQQNVQRSGEALSQVIQEQHVPLENGLRNIQASSQQQPVNDALQESFERHQQLQALQRSCCNEECCDECCKCSMFSFGCTFQAGLFGVAGVGLLCGIPAFLIWVVVSMAKG